MMPIRCPHCGTANRSGSNFCNSCGTELRTTETKPSAGSAALPDAARPGGADPPEPEGGSEPGAALPWLADPALWSGTDNAALGELTDPDSDQSGFADEVEGESTAEPEPVARAGRLIVGVQGLLDPVRIADDLTGEPTPTQLPRTPSAIDLDSELLRRLRTLVTQDPTLLNTPAEIEWRPLRMLRIPWIFALLGLMVGLPVLLLYARPVGNPHAWPGVAEAYTTVQNLPPAAPVLILWGYDPSTADEMDLVALPMMAHLFDRQSRPVVVTLLPTGLATARRLFARATADQSANQTFDARPNPTVYSEIGFLPGGAVALSWLGQNDNFSLIDSEKLTPELAQALAAGPALAIVVAAQAEDVQQWLELVQPLAQMRRTPVVAFTSAGADLALRPYFASGQLRGLVSGFDGGYTYQQLRARPLSQPEETLYRLHLVFQNWGHMAFLLIIVLGNLAALLGVRTK